MNMRLKKSLLVMAPLAFLITSPAYGQTIDSLPTSSVTTARPWLKMNPTTFPVSTASVLEQFDRVSRYHLGLNSQDRARLAMLLETNGGVEVMVPDGITFNYLTGRCDGKPCVYEKMRKQLGRVDRALLFDLGNGKFVYWFTGERGKSCNNIGVVINSPPPIAFTSTPPPPAPPKKNCRLVPVTQPGTQPRFRYIAEGVACCLSCTPPPSLL